MKSVQGENIGYLFKYFHVLCWFSKNKQKANPREQSKRKQSFKIKSTKKEHSDFDGNTRVV